MRNAAIRTLTATTMSSASDIALVAGRFGGIRPTAAERRHGRLLRAPDHDAGTGGDAPAAPAAPAGDPAPAPAGDGTPPAASPPAAEQPPASPAPGSEAPKEPAAPETSLLDGGVKTPPADPNAQPAAEAPVVPEAYEIALEGTDLDAKAIEAATPVFKEMGLTNDQANKLMPAAVQFRDQVAEATLQQVIDAGAQQKKGWLDATTADPEIGGGKLDETLHLAAKGLDYLGYPEGSDFRKQLTETGFGNHPEMVRMMRKVGEMVSEDGFPRSGATPASQISAEKRLYPND